MVSLALTVLAVILLSYIASVESVTGEIISCPGCKLNKLPESGQADSYNDLKITFIQGRNPDLLIKDDAGNVVERIDLSKMRNTEIHALMASKGFTRKEGSPPLVEDQGIQTGALLAANAAANAAAPSSSDISKVGSITGGLPVQRDSVMRAGTGGRLRKRQESLMKAMAHLEQQQQAVTSGANSNSNTDAAALHQ